MKRCANAFENPITTPRTGRLAKLALAVGLSGLLALAAAPQVQAQSLDRIFPRKALRGTMVVVQPPMITIDGEPARLSPGSRIRSTSNTTLRSSSLVGQELVVNYVRDPREAVHEVWILNPSEVAKKMPTAGTERNFRFASEEPAPSPSLN